MGALPIGTPYIVPTGNAALANLARNRRSPEDVLDGLLAANANDSAAAGLALLRAAQDHGVSLKDYLTLAINPALSTKRADIAAANLSGFEASLAYLNLPTRTNFQEGVVLEAAAQTFDTTPGARALFPEVIDTMLRWQNRMVSFENTTGMVSSTRTVAGNQMISYVVEDGPDGENAYDSFVIAEGGQVPVRSIRTSQTAVTFYKHGSGYEVTYEFARRASIDLLSPFAARVQRRLESSKVRAATLTMINGDGVNAAATVVQQSAYAGATNNGKINYEALLEWLCARAQKGVPVDTVIGNFATYLQWLKLFYLPSANSGKVDAETLAAAGVTVGRLPLINFNVDFVLSSSVPNGKLLGITKAETIEELVEANSLISQSEQAIRNQVITYVRTENTGYRLTFGDTREIYQFGT